MADGCSECNAWRSRAFDGLGYLAWHAKAERWGKRGRKQKFCRKCRRYRWLKKLKEAPNA